MGGAVLPQIPRKRICLCYVLMFTAAHALCHSADSKLGSIYDVHEPLSGIGKQGYWRIDHPPQPHCQCHNAHVFAQCVQTFCGGKLGFGRTTAEVCLPERMRGNVPLVPFVEGYAYGRWADVVWNCHVGAILQLWCYHTSCPVGKHILRCGSPVGGAGLGPASRDFVLCSDAPCTSFPVGNLNLGHMCAEHHSGLACAQLRCAPAGGIRLDHAVAKHSQSRIGSRAGCSHGLVGGKRLGYGYSQCRWIPVDARLSTRSVGGIGPCRVKAEYCRVPTRALAHTGHSPGGGTRLGHGKGVPHLLLAPALPTGSRGCMPSHGLHSLECVRGKLQHPGVGPTYPYMRTPRISWARGPLTPLFCFSRIASMSTTTDTSRSRLGTDGVMDTSSHYRDSVVSLDAATMPDGRKTLAGARQLHRGKEAFRSGLGQSLLLRPKPEKRRSRARVDADPSRVAQPETTTALHGAISPKPSPRKGEFAQTPSSARADSRGRRIKPRKGEVERFMSVLGSPVSQALDSHGTIEASVLQFFRDACAESPEATAGADSYESHSTRPKGDGANKTPDTPPYREPPTGASAGTDMHTADYIRSLQRRLREAEAQIAAHALSDTNKDSRGYSRHNGGSGTTDAPHARRHGQRGARSGLPDPRLQAEPDPGGSPPPGGDAD